MDHTNPTSSVPFSAPVWTCPTCNTTTSIFHRTSHLHSLPHLRNLVAAPSTTRFTAWHCDVCSKTMNVFYRREHLSSVTHQELYIKGARSDFSMTSEIGAESLHDVGTQRFGEYPLPMFNCGICNAFVPLVDIGKHLDVSVHRECERCARFIHADWQERHLAVCEVQDASPNDEPAGVQLDTPEVENYKKSPVEDLLSFNNNRIVSPSWDQPPDLSNPEHDRQSHPEGNHFRHQDQPNIPHPNTPSPPSETPKINTHSESLNSLELPKLLWTCNICQMAMPEDAKASHLNGKKHAKTAKQQNPPSSLQHHITSDNTFSEDSPSISIKIQAKPSQITQVLSSHNAIISGPSALGLALEAVRLSPWGFIPTTEIPAVSSGDWTCGVCVRTMAAGSKDEHLGGKRHRAKEQIQQEEMRMEAEKVLERKELERKKAEQTQQRVELERKKVQAQREKLARKKAEEAQRREELERQAGEARQREELARKKVEAQQRGDLKRKVEAQREELARKRVEEVKHQLDEEREWMAELERQRAEQLSDKEPPQHWHCDICGRTMDPNVRNAHIWGSSHQQRLTRYQESMGFPPGPPVPSNNSKWECTVCDRAMFLQDKGLHLAGIKHQTKLKAQPVLPSLPH